MKATREWNYWIGSLVSAVLMYGALAYVWDPITGIAAGIAMFLLALIIKQYVDTAEVVVRSQ